MKDGRRIFPLFPEPQRLCDMKRIIALSFAVVSLTATRAAGPDSLSGGLVWRNIGPLRAGRVSAVSGAVGEAGVFYAGFPTGGLWKTSNAGVTWDPVFDDVTSTSSIGAVQVAPSDTNVIYVGTGDMRSEEHTSELQSQFHLVCR